jgi:hypothetical protein
LRARETWGGCRWRVCPLCEKIRGQKEGCLERAAAEVERKARSGSQTIIFFSHAAACRRSRPAAGPARGPARPPDLCPAQACPPGALPATRGARGAACPGTPPQVHYGGIGRQRKRGRPCGACRVFGPSPCSRGCKRGRHQAAVWVERGRARARVEREFASRVNLSTRPLPSHHLSSFLIITSTPSPGTPPPPPARSAWPACSSSSSSIRRARPSRPSC